LSTTSRSRPVSEWQLDSGEAQVIAQALAQKDPIIVLDDLAARRCARAWSSR
jgi:predicted nucleic acid-binding protein